MKDLLFLCHRIPYPPNKGDKIRSFHMLKHLSENYSIHLGAFIDDPNDWQYIDELKKYCSDACFIKLQSLPAKIKSLTALLGDKALSLPYYYSRQLQEWVDEKIERQSINKAFIFSGAMAQYVEDHINDGCHAVIDFVDVDSDKWRQYSQNKSWPMSALYEREYRYLLEYETRIAKQFSASIFVSEKEAELFKQLAPQTAQKVTFINNGVDVDYFSPDNNYSNPYSPDDLVLVFTGAMDYWANVEAVCWFSAEVYPKIKAANQAVKFFIVGSNPSDDVGKLAAIDGVVVTGAVDDVRPFLTHATLAVAPLRIARGVQNKVLEAMAMNKVVVMTSQAQEGIKHCSSMGQMVSDDPDKMAELVIHFLQDQQHRQQVGQQGRPFILENYQWDSSLQQLNELIEG